MLGIGGGIFYVPGLNELFILSNIAPEMTMHLALGTSTTVNVFNALINLSRHQKHKAVNWTIAMSLMPSLILGAFIGGYVAGYLPTQILKTIFALILLFIGMHYTFKRHRPSTRPLPSRGYMTAAGLLIGVIASINGLGGGVLMVPFLNRFQLHMREIVAISAACILPQSLFGMMGYMISGWNQPDLPPYALGYVYWPVAIPLVITSLIFVPLGVTLVHALPQTTVRRIFGMLLLVVCAYMLFSSYVRL
jgi:uncharacterized membrane protein YfcA